MVAGCLLVGRITVAAGNDFPGIDPGFQQKVAAAKREVFPAVVFINVIQTDSESGGGAKAASAGSGVLVATNGEILTNWHVIDKAESIRCLLMDGQAYPATLIGSDKDVDIALLKLTSTRGDFPVAPLGRSGDLTEGDFVLAMGAPWGLSRSISLGIVSCTQRYLPAGAFSLWLQTDASISPGNSGGPLVDLQGRVVGINTRGGMAGGDIGFAVPVDTIAELLPLLRRHGKVPWSWNGLLLQAINDFSRDTYFDAAPGGVIVSGTEPNSPARRAGLQARDRILAVDGHPLLALTEESLPDIQRRLGLLPAGQAVTLTVLRDGASRAVALTPVLKGAVEGDFRDFKRWGLTVKSINQFDNPELFLHRREGLFISAIDRRGNAAEADFRRNDILLDIDGHEARTLDQVQALYDQAVRDAARRSRVVVRLLRNGVERQSVLDYAIDDEAD